MTKEGQQTSDLAALALLLQAEDTVASHALQGIAHIVRSKGVRHLALNPGLLRTVCEDEIRTFADAIQDAANLRRLFPEIFDDLEEWGRQQILPVKAGPQRHCEPAEGSDRGTL